MSELSSKHHTLIQALLSRGPLAEKDFNFIFEGVSGKNPANNKKLLNDQLLKINKELAFVQFELRGCRNQYDGKIYYGIVNNIADEQAKFGTQYSVPQIAFYKAVIEAIVQDETAQGSISNTDALNVSLEHQVQNGLSSQSQAGSSVIPMAFKNFSKTQKEKTLNELVRDRWLCSTSDGNVGLGVRSFLDLRSWFHNNDVPPCHVCNEAGVKADLCQNEECIVRIHNYCLRKKFSQKRVDKLCPGCGTEWPNPEPKSEFIEEDEGEDQNQPIQSQVPLSGSAKRKRPRNCKSESDAVNTGPSQPSQRVPDLRRSSRRSTRLR
ncbi:Non-structural maintenance of chromosomes element 1-like protein [Thalictrum thalictroides]|uniref:Non-structural maintenance of chromosomes element 1 homolog n=1 Tax=Thalictrum thalictroides TaxID=46969 RepID=A0A7J6WW41_THATH|nr:Non-structural maintenance of chromosomes element 1-like protein [Thalictrum thalictroides]